MQKNETFNKEDVRTNSLTRLMEAYTASYGLARLNTTKNGCSKKEDYSKEGERAYKV
jgi:hypothetical protein